MRSSIVKALSSIVFLITLLSCTPKEERLKTSNINSTFDFDTNKNFEEYVSYSRSIIKRGRIDLNSHNKNQVISWNAPFILRPNNKHCSDKDTKGILLIHGLSDSPFTSKTIAHYLNKNCFTIYSILLTGHGTRPGDLLKVSYKDWIRQIEYGIKELSKKSSKIYLGGFSAGGTLAVNYILSNPSTKIEAIILLSPALNLEKKAALAPMVKFFKQYLEIHEDKDLVKYESFTMNAAAQIYLLTKEVRKKLNRNNAALKNIKTFAALTYEDKTINPLKTLDTILDNTNPNTRHIILYYQNQLPKNIAKHKGLYPIQTTIAKDKILNLSHGSLAFDPKNTWYGKNGKYRNCLHYHKYKQESQKYSLCKSLPTIYYGEITDDNLNKNIVARLTYNPFTEKLLTSLKSFLQN